MQTKQGNSIYYSYFTDSGIAAFNELFPDWRNVQLPPLDKKLINLFKSPIINHEQLTGSLMKIADWHGCSIHVLKPQINKAISLVAEAHGKKYSEWELALQQATKKQIMLGFLTKYPMWREAGLSLEAIEILSLLYGLDNNIPVTMAKAGIIMETTRQAIQYKRDEALEILDVSHGYAEIGSPVKKSIEARQEFANKLIAFRGDRTQAKMARYFRVDYGTYWKLEHADVKFLTEEHYTIFAEALQ